MNAPTANIFNPSPVGGFLTVVYDGKPLTIRSDNPNFDAAKDAFKAQEWETLRNIINPTIAVAAATAKFEAIEVRDNAVFYEGEPVNGVIVDRILAFQQEGLDFLPLVKFLAKLMLNPSKRAVDELYTFLEHQNLPITESGNFLAYKGLLSDFYSITSGKVKLLKGTANESGQIFNGIGEEIEIPRNQVDDNKDRGCSYGLHAGTLEYASSFAQGKLVIVEIDPSYVVSIPTDCSFQKLRTAAYKVVDEYTGALVRPVYASRYSTPSDQIVDDMFDGYDEDGDDDDYETPTDVNGEAYVDGELYRDGVGDVFRFDGDGFVRVKPFDEDWLDIEEAEPMERIS